MVTTSQQAKLDLLRMEIKENEQNYGEVQKKETMGLARDISIQSLPAKKVDINEEMINVSIIPTPSRARVLTKIGSLPPN